MSDALQIIHREHRAIAAVVHCLDHVLKDIADQRVAPDFDLFDAIIDYIEDFPDRFHHPKEDDYLFAALRGRDPTIAATLDELQAEHREGERRIAGLRWKLDDWRKDPEGGFEPFRAEAMAYIDFQRRHLALEESKVIPAAREYLTQNDWRSINAAFADNDDPIFGDRPREAYDKLFARIVALAPAPYGLAEPHKPTRPVKEAALPRYVRKELLNLPWV